MKKLMVVAAAAAALAGCTSVEITREGSYNDAQLKMNDCSSNPYWIDWDVKPARVDGTGASTCWFWFFASTDGRSYAAPGFTFDSGVAAAKDSATFDAVEKAKSDALLGCMYRITKTSKWLGIYIAVPRLVILTSELNPKGRRNPFRRPLLHWRDAEGG